jgi:cardiolipin synthase
VSGVGGNRFQLYTEGDAFYARLLECIHRASDSILIESYIFADDEIGRRFTHALAERVRAGVEVKLHLDAAASLVWGSNRLQRAFERANIDVRWFHRWNWREPLHYNRRNHRKLAVFDRRRAFLGGFNIHRESSRAVYGENRWRDTQVEFEGPLAAQAAALFDVFWRQGAGARIRVDSSDDNMLVSSHAVRGRYYLHYLYATHFRSAEACIFLSTPYFVPDRRTQQGLIAAARRNVDVRVLVSRKSDSRLAQWAARATYAKLLRAGVKVYEYLPRVLHTKTLVVDGRRACIGTANVDYRSFFSNYELNLFSRDRALAEALEEQFLVDLEQSERILPRTWAKRRWRAHLAELIGWFARRLL